MRFRLLPYEVEVTAEDEGLASKLAYLANGARQDVPVQGSLRYGVEGFGPYDLTEDGGPLESVATPDDVLFVLYRHCYERLLDHLRADEWLPLHGGLVIIAGRRLLVVGQKGAGKTTLMLRLLHDGHDVEGDEMVFARDGIAVALPRPFHVKPGTDLVLPELAGRLDALPFTSTSDGMPITAFDPAAAGFDWHIRSGPIDGAVILRANHGGSTAIRSLSNVELVQQVVDHAFPASDSRSALLRSCAALVGQADGIELAVGAVDTAATALVNFATVSES